MRFPVRHLKFLSRKKKNNSNYARAKQSRWKMLRQIFWERSFQFIWKIYCWGWHKYCCIKNRGGTRQASKFVPIILRPFKKSPFGVLWISKNLSVSHSLVLDLDECAESPCGALFECVNTIGSYRCQCRPGYKGSKCDVGKQLSSGPNLVPRVFSLTLGTRFLRPQPHVSGY